MCARRVVVTGVGAVSPLGLTAASTWDGLVSGRSGVGAITLFAADDFPVRIAGQRVQVQVGEHARQLLVHPRRIMRDLVGVQSVQAQPAGDRNRLVARDRDPQTEVIVLRPEAPFVAISLGYGCVRRRSSHVR